MPWYYWQRWRCRGGRSGATGNSVAGTAREIRRNEAGTGRRIPVIAMTAHGLAQERERCFEAGMDGFVAKPIQTAELYAELAKWAEIRDMGSEQRQAA